MAKRFIFSKLYRNLPRVGGFITLILGLATLSIGILMLLSSKGLIAKIPVFEATLLNPYFIPIGSTLVGAGGLFLILCPILFIIQHRIDSRRRQHEATLVIRDADLKVSKDSKKPHQSARLSSESSVEEFPIESPRVRDETTLVPYSTDQETPLLKRS